MEPVETAKVAVLELGATVTEGGRVRPGSPVAVSETTMPLEAVGLESVTVQLLLALAPSVVGLHCREETTVGAVKARVTDWEELL